jgi:type IV pilus assembly protein PilN
MTASFLADLNIASQPFRRERAQNAVWAVAAVALFISLIVLSLLFVHQRSEAADLRRGNEAQRRELARLQRLQAQFAGVLAKPQNADVLSRSVMLNELIARRSVSWTRVFEDLETVLPANVRLLSVRLPQVNAESGPGRNKVELDMWVGSERPDAVIEVLKHLQTSPLFGAASVMTQTPPAQNDPLFKYRLTVAYAQKL